jgi:geranylgeranyl diphosphate synthase type I
MTALTPTPHPSPGFPSPGGQPRERVNHALTAFLDHIRESFTTPAELVEILDAVRAFVLDGGKRLRPQFCYWGWHGAGGLEQDVDTVIHAAASLEIFHAFALIHDDIMDMSRTRRGRPSLHTALATLHRRRGWRGCPEHIGVSLAILAGDMCLTWSDALIDAGGIPPERWRRAREVLHQMRTEILTGQYLDLLGQATTASLPQALRIIRLKTAQYTVERPLHLGAILAGAEPAVLRRYSEFGIPLGEAFQLRDDLLGAFGDSAITGKSAVDDFREGKPTVLVALAREHASPAQRARLTELYGNPDLDAHDAATVREILTTTGARSRVETMIGQRADRALAALHAAAITGQAQRALRALAHAATIRDC